MSASRQPSLDMLYVVVAGAGTARRMPDIVTQLAPHFRQVAIVPTEHASRVISRRELALLDDVQIVDSYFDELILPYPPEGVVLVAPCTFNSLNKLAGGVADNLALSITAEAIGRGTPVVVAVSVNPPLFAHPRTRMSMETLRSWGIDMIAPTESNGWMTLADDADIVRAVLTARERWTSS